MTTASEYADELSRWIERQVDASSEELPNLTSAIWNKVVVDIGNLQREEAQPDFTVGQEPKRRLKACVEAWPDCYSFGYDPRCCRFPKSCSCTAYDPVLVSDDALEKP